MRHLLPLLLLAGCGGKSVKSVVDAHRAAATAKLAKIAALAPIVEKQPTLVKDVWNIPQGVRLHYKPFVELYNSDMSRDPHPDYNTAIALEHLLAKPSTADHIFWDSGNKGLFLLSGIDHSQEWLLEPAAVLETGARRYGSEPVASILDEGLSWLERTKYLVVLRVPTRVPPGLVMEELKAREMKTFTGGRVAGDALLYDIESASFLGGFAFEGKSDEKVEVHDTYVHEQLASKLAKNAEEVIKKKLAEVGDTPQ